MIAISPALVPEIDRYAAEVLGIPVATLMGRAGEAVARAAARHLAPGGCALILAGGGNNGGDGYAAALALLRLGHRAVVADVTGRGQSGEAGRAYLAAYRETVGEPLTLGEAEGVPHEVLIDAVLGTGARLPLGEAFAPISALIRASRAYKIAIDLPLGADAEWGGTDPLAARVDETVMLGFPKQGLLSYPARTLVGGITVDDIGLDLPEVRERFSLTDRATDLSDLPSLAPHRAANTHKGSFGHLLILAGSRRYRGAALLSTAAALRMGAGLVTLASDEAVLEAAAISLPEAILAPQPADTAAALALADGKSAILLGPGCGADEETLARTLALLTTRGSPLVLDADALTVLAYAGERGLTALHTAARPVILTPHPLEFARLVGKSVPEVQAARLSLACRFTGEYPVTLVLKGAGTVVAEGGECKVNLTGGPALAKGGSGDVLAGAIASLLATGLAPAVAARLAVLLHGAAGDRLSAEYSPLGVRPHDLPAEMARVLSEAYR